MFELWKNGLTALMAFCVPLTEMERVSEDFSPFRSYILFGRESFELNFPAIMRTWDFYDFLIYDVPDRIEKLQL